MRAHSLAFQRVTNANGEHKPRAGIRSIQRKGKSAALKDIPRNNFARTGLAVPRLRAAIDDRAAVVPDRGGSREDSRGEKNGKQ